MPAMKIKLTEDYTVTLPEGSLTNFQESAQNGKDLPEKLNVVVEAIHSGITRNYTSYPANNLEKSVESWLAPYEKPVIKNHNTWEEPVGRVNGARFKDSNIAPGMKTIELDLEISDPDSIKKVMDGRYRTLSIGGSTNSVTCSVCAKDMVKEGYCGHRKGRTYEGQTAHWIIGEMSFDEISWVNVPADQNAQVVSVSAQKQTESAGQVEGGQNMPTADTQADDILAQVEALRNQQENPEGEPAGAAQTTESQTDNQTPPAADPADPAGPADPAVQTEAQTGDEPGGAADPEKTVEEQLAEATAKIADFVTEVEGLKESNITLQTTNDALLGEKADLEEKVANLEKEIGISNQESDSLRKQSITLATYTHKVLAESAARIELVLGKVEESALEGRLEELTKETSANLKTKIQELSQEKIQRQVQTVSNPLHEGAEGDVVESTTPAKEEEFTLEQFEEKVKMALTGNYFK